jgi:hypothetical protein
MAYCTLAEAWGSNFFNDSLKNSNIHQNSFLETLKTPNMTRSYNNLPNTNGPTSRYINNNINSNINYDNQPSSPSSELPTQDKQSSPPNEVLTQGNISSDDKIEYNLNNHKNIKYEDDIIKKDNIDLNKLVQSYKKYFKKSKKILSTLTLNLDILKKNSKLYLILLILSLIFNFILLIIIIIIILIK